MAVPEQSFLKRIKAPDPKSLPEFPAKWPSKPIPYMPTGVTDYFMGPFKIQVHPQKIIIPKNGTFKFGIKNPTDKPVGYYFEKHSSDVEFKNQKGDTIDRGFLDPGEIVRLSAVHKEAVAYDARDRRMKISYRVLDKKEDAADIKAKQCPYTREDDMKGHYYSEMIVEPEPELHERPPPPPPDPNVCPYPEGSSGYYDWHEGRGSLG